MRIRPIMLIAATAAAIATAGGVASAATGTPQPAATAHGKPSAAPAAPAAKAHGTGSTGASVVSGTRVTATRSGFSVAGTRTSPIGAGAVAGILASCLGSDASNYHAVLAVRTPVAASDVDGVVVAVNSAHQYVQCETKGHKGSSMSSPATFINDRLWGTGHLVEFFDSFSEPADGGQSLALGAGHYTSDVARITISYGDNPTQYPALMAGGAFVYSAAFSGLEGNAPAPAPHVHAYDAAGKEIYNQLTQPNTKP